jgi:putative nucleotidyltransferase with HDIG domain
MKLKFNLTTRLFWIVAVLVVSIAGVDTTLRYIETQNIIESRGYTRAKALQDYFVSMRYVYQQQFLKSGIDLNDSTVGFLPAHAASIISDEFGKRTTQGISVRNVSDQPRNPSNRADKIEIEAMKYFSANPDQNETTRHIEENGREVFFFAAPLRIQPYCLECHGEKSSVREYIRNKYDTAYGYKIGDVRGLTSIKIPVDTLAAPMMKVFWKTTLFAFGLLGVLLVLVYIAIKRATRSEAQIKKELEELVAQKTAELENLYTQEKHLGSILRTVADVNQLLITTENIDELIDKSAKTLSSNESFKSVKILLAIDGKLEVKALYGVGDEKIVAEIDGSVFVSGNSVMLADLEDGSVPQYYRQKAKTYGINAVYSVPLRSSSFDLYPIGVMTVCTEQKGFNEKERAMIDELAGDIGFAVNSFMQKKTIELLNSEKLNNYEEFINALVDMIEQRDTYTAGHTRRVAEYSVMIANELGLSQGDIKKLAEAAKLHDIGKVVTPDSVLLKPGALTKLEYELIKEHVAAGFQVLSNIGSYDELANIIIFHHERYDGSGYPFGKKGEEISMLGHILAVADSFDAMTTNRIYKPRKSVEESIAELKSLSGTWYHPVVVDAAIKVLTGIDVEFVVDQAIGASEIDRERLSYFFKDRLTKLYNEDYLTLVINGRSEHKAPKSLSVISLVSFTKFNKEHTWEGGNNLLVEFAEFLAASMEEALIFRIWGDHFVVADCEKDIDELISNSPLVKNKVEYKIRTISSPFDNIKEALLRA